MYETLSVQLNWDTNCVPLLLLRIVYFDETGDECAGVDVHQPATFAHKNLQLHGVTVFWDEFSESTRNGLRSPSGKVVRSVAVTSTPIKLTVCANPTSLPWRCQETEAKLSPSWNPRITCEPHPQFTEPVSATTPFNPTQIGSLSGRVELSLVLKQNETVPGAKVGGASSCICFLFAIPVLDGWGNGAALLPFSWMSTGRSIPWLCCCLRGKSTSFLTCLASFPAPVSFRSTVLLLPLPSLFFFFFWPAALRPAELERGGLARDRRNRPMQLEDENRLRAELSRCLKKESVTSAAPGDEDFFEADTTRTTSSRGS